MLKIPIHPLPVVVTQLPLEAIETGHFSHLSITFSFLTMFSKTFIELFQLFVHYLK